MSGPLGSQQWMYSTGFYPYEIDQSLRFNDDDSAYLSRTPASAGNRKTWTWSGWVKRGNIGTQHLLDVRSGGNISVFAFGANGEIISSLWYGYTSYYGCETSAKFRDISAWYHIVIKFDSTQATASNRLKFYVNGVSQTIILSSGYPATYPPQNIDSFINSTFIHSIATDNLGGGYLDGYMAEVNFIDGQALDPTDFGEFKSGVWIPKSYSGTYGTNGFYLDFGNSGSLGADSSGNGNNWTPNNLAATDQVLDSPTNNFATLNSLGTSTATFSEGNLRGNLSVTNGAASATMASGSGKYYWEILGSSYSNNGMVIGVRDSDNPSSGTYGADGVFYYGSGGSIYVDGSVTDTVATYGVTDIISVAIDLDSDTVKFYKNNSLQITKSLPQTGKTWQPQFGEGTSAGDNAFLANFGQDSSFAGNKTAQGNTDANGIGDFYYAPPAGYLALCTANLPDPVIDPAQDDVPADYFNTVLWTGNGTSQSITGVGFQPDWVWTKERSSGSGHYLHDVVRGVDKLLQSNETNAEITYNQAVTSFDTDGFGVGNDGGINESGATYVAWNWKAGGTGVSNTDGTITSTVSANTDAGFSIVTFTTDGSNTTVGTGLSSSAPLDMVVIKRRDSTSEWQVGHRFSGQGSNFAYHLELNSTSALSGAGPYFMGTHSASNGDRIYLASGASGVSSATWVAYCFQSVEGFSKFGSYTGNGSTDGPFVYTGFRPAFVMIKRIDTTENWHMQDSARSSYNWESATVYANLSNAEYTGSAFEQDYLSNGFKLRTTNAGFNTSGGTYIYMAFAEMPFKYSNAR